MAIYWGNDESGNFYLIPKSQWSKKLVLDKEQLAREIQSTGRKSPNQSDQDFAASRQKLAGEYLRLWDVFEEASKGTQGFFTGDMMFAQKQQPGKDGNYVFTPNKVTYTVAPKGLYGKMPTAEAFITVHGKATELGSSALAPATPREIAQLNSTPGLIAIGAQRPAGPIALDTKPIDTVAAELKANARAVDAISNYTAPKFTTLKQVLYNYAVKLGKSNDQLDFGDWLQTSKVSAAQQAAIQQLAQTPEWKTFWDMFMKLKQVKYYVFDQLTKQHGDVMWKELGITATTNGKPGGEGYVTPAGKIVNPAFRSAPDNPRFTGEI